MMLLDAYLKAALKVAERIGSSVLSAALQQFLSVGASQDGDCNGDGNTDELETVWDELAAAAGDTAGASFEILHSVFDGQHPTTMPTAYISESALNVAAVYAPVVVGRWVFTEDIDPASQAPMCVRAQPAQNFRSAKLKGAFA